MNLLGFGVLSYFIVMRTLFKTFFWLGLCFVPLIYNYQSFNDQMQLDKSFLDTTTFGNLGESTPKCVTFMPKAANNHPMLGCESGLIQEISSVGAYQEGSEADLNHVCQVQTQF